MPFSGSSHRKGYLKTAGYQSSQFYFSNMYACSTGLRIILPFLEHIQYVDSYLQHRHFLMLRGEQAWKNWVTQNSARWPRNFVIWREILLFEGKNRAILEGNLHFSSPGPWEIIFFPALEVSTFDHLLAAKLSF